MQELEIWLCVTDLGKTKQDPEVYLSLKDKIRKSCNDISVRDTNKNDEFDTLIRKIKSLYAKDTNTLAFMTYDKFENFKRLDMNIADYSVTYSGHLGDWYTSLGTQTPTPEKHF